MKFISHKVKAKLYKERAKLKKISVSDLFPDASAVTRVESDNIFLNENLTSYKKFFQKANAMRKDGELLSVWTMDGTIYVKTSLAGRPIKIKEIEDRQSL